MRILPDTCVIVDALQKRKSFREDSVAIFRVIQQIIVDIIVTGNIKDSGLPGLPQCFRKNPCMFRCKQKFRI